MTLLLKLIYAMESNVYVSNIIEALPGGGGGAPMAPG